MNTQHFDVVFVGSGQGAGPLATTFVAAGRTTALIEREHIGGTCINEGCTPSKTMIASGRIAYLARRSGDYGIHTGPVSVAEPEVRQRKRDMVRDFREGSTMRIEEGGTHIIYGEACFTGPKSLQVCLMEGGTMAVTADIIVLNTGARPADPSLPGLDAVPHFNSTTIMELEEVPDHLICLGGGYVGLEFAQLFRRLGSKVTVVQLLPKLMGREDPDIADAVAEILREDGIEILLETVAQRVEGTDGNINLTVKTPHGERVLTGSHLLVAVGRAPNIEALDLDKAGVEVTDRKFIKVNERLETTAPGVYAIGDVAGSPAFTHISYDDFRILRANLLHGGSRTTTDRLIPYTMFTDPELGRVGITEEQARKENRPIKVGKIPMSAIARALEAGESRGMMKAVVDAETDQILGVSVLGISGGEIMAMLEIAMMGKVPYTALRDGIFAHPTLAESLNTLFTAVDG